MDAPGNDEPACRADSHPLSTEASPSLSASSGTTAAVGAPAPDPPCQQQGAAASRSRVDPGRVDEGARPNGTESAITTATTGRPEAFLDPRHEETEEASEKSREDQASSGPGSELEPATTCGSSIRRPQSLPGEALFVFVLCSAQLMTQAGLALSIVPQHIIGPSLGVTSSGQLSWFSAAYSLTVGTFILVAGRFGDVFGYKRFFVGGFVWFAFWSMVAGVAVYQGPALFDFSRAMQGVGPAFMLPNSIAILGRSYEPGRRQSMVFSLFGATAPGGFVIGAAFCSLLSQKLWWPWAYWFMCFACLLYALVGFLIIPPTPAPPAQDKTASLVSRLDLLGSVTGVAALVIFNFAWNQGPVVGWPVPYTYVMLIVGSLLFVAFWLVEKRVSEPLIPFGALKIDSLFTLACISCGWGSFGIFTLYYWNFLEVIRGQTPLLTTAQFSPVSVSGFIAAMTTGYVLGRLPAAVVMLIAMLAFTTGGAIICSIPVHQTYWAQSFVGMLVLPWGMDMSFPAATILLSRAMPRKHQGLAASLVNTFVNYSISIGLGIGATVETNVNKGGRDLLAGFRGAWYVGVGLASLGVVVASAFCLTMWFRSVKSPSRSSNDA